MAYSLTDSQKLMRDVIVKHRRSSFSDICACGEQTDDNHSDHLAVEVDKALSSAGLDRQIV